MVLLFDILVETVGYIFVRITPRSKRNQEHVSYARGTEMSKGTGTRSHRLMSRFKLLSMYCIFSSDCIVRKATLEYGAGIIMWTGSILDHRKANHKRTRLRSLGFHSFGSSNCCLTLASCSFVGTSTITKYKMSFFIIFPMIGIFLLGVPVILPLTFLPIYASCLS